MQERPCASMPVISVRTRATLLSRSAERDPLCRRLEVLGLRLEPDTCLHRLVRRGVELLDVVGAPVRIEAREGRRVEHLDEPEDSAEAGAVRANALVGRQ